VNFFVASQVVGRQVPDSTCCHP